MVRRYFKIVENVNRWDEQYQSLSDEALRDKTQEFRDRLNKGESLDNLLPEAFGVVKNACRRMCGTEIHVSGYDQKWDMIPYDVQIVGAIAMHHGSIAEMQTGEGKTLTAVLPLYLNALTGKPVHLVTVNDYLVSRDCQWAGSILRWLGLTTAVLKNSTPMEERKAVYQADVVYGTASEFGFDYLRDNSMASNKNEQVQRGYFYAIIDEVDSILVDEARTPLIISGPVPESRQMYAELKDDVSELVKIQRDYCNQIASESKKLLESRGLLNEETSSRKLTEDENQALQQLWLVSKGTPRNKILKRIRENPDLRAALDKWDLYYYSDANKEEKYNMLAKLYIIIDERSSEFELTDKGTHQWQKVSKGDSEDFLMLDLGYEYQLIDEDSDLSDDEKLQKKLKIQEEDTLRKERSHNLRQLLRAHLLMERDVDYIVQNDEIVIIDENTGRPQPGRRFSDGLHQAIEAKESVKIQKETQTYATITLQNYFRMYAKRAGMTGTATTEAHEFKQIYNMDVLEIPTHKKCLRVDANDEIYMTEREKYNAIYRDVLEEHKKGRPILIGTESVEVSEKLSRIFKLNNLPHSVLNAKYHDTEAEIVAQAGQNGMITISTNMAGRGTDIKLGEGVASIGGLYVIGTTRHQSRRIDRQLRGRCARQGDPGTSKFYISFEDSLLRLFASPTLTSILQKYRPPEGEPISASILNSSIATAQKRLEQRNFMIRKHTLEYDDVMNKQRQEVYAFRNEIIRSDDPIPLAIEILKQVCGHGADKYFFSHSEENGWNPEGYRQWLMQIFPISFNLKEFDDDRYDIADIEEIASQKIIQQFEEKIALEKQKIQGAQTTSGQDPVTSTIRRIMVQKLDKFWQEHLLSMDHLRAEVSLRAVGQRDPLMEFKHEAFRLFDELGTNLREEIAHDLFRFSIAPPMQMTLADLLAKLRLETDRSLAFDAIPPSPATPEESLKVQPPFVEDKTKRNEACSCGSGKKYKKCCGPQSSEN